MPRLSDSAGQQVRSRRTRLLRFTRAERWVHQSTAVLAAVCVATAACLYIGPLAELVGRRRLMVILHEWSGIGLPVPVLLGLASRALRSDLGRLNRFEDRDRQWLRAAVRHRDTSRVPSGKFNAGQKVYASWAAGAGVVMVGTGLMLWFPQLWPLTLRMGATFVHDWLALAITAIVAAHIWKASGDSGAREGMWCGTVSRTWAERQHPLWQQEMDRDRVSKGIAEGPAITDRTTLP